MILLAGDTLVLYATMKSGAFLAFVIAVDDFQGLTQDTVSRLGTRLASCALFTNERRRAT